MDELNEMMGFLITSGKVDNTFALVEEKEEDDEEELEDNIFNFESSTKKPKTKIKK